MRFSNDCCDRTGSDLKKQPRVRLALLLLIAGCSTPSYNEWVAERCRAVCWSVAVSVDGRNVCFCAEFYK